MTQHEAHQIVELIIADLKDHVLFGPIARRLDDIEEAELYTKWTHHIRDSVNMTHVSRRR